MSYESGPLEHQEGCRVLHDGYGVCRCKAAPSALTREQVELDIAKAQSGDPGFISAGDRILAHDAAQRQSLSQQAQEVERLKVELEECKHQNGISAREIELDQQLAAMTAERDAYKAVLIGAKYRQVKAIGKLSVGQATNLGKEAASITKQVIVERDVFTTLAESNARSIEDKGKQLAASQARVKELEKECAGLAAGSCEAPYGDDYGNKRCKTIDQLQATLAAREAELLKLARSHDEMLGRLGEAERDLYSALYEHGKDNGMWGKWCARLLTQRDAAVQRAERAEARVKELEGRQ